MTITEMVADAYATAKDKGWHRDELNIPEKLALIHAEVSEALESYRRTTEPQLVVYGKRLKPEGFGTELADVVIRVADLCGALDIDLEKRIAEKMRFNKTRPYRHGNKAC